MRTYFDNVDTLHRYTLELDLHQDELLCPNWFKCNSFVSHGFVYKQISSTQKVVVGKRIFCTNRHAKTGCGTTRRLYLAETIPSLRYSTQHLFTFLLSLIALCSIQQAYEAATGTKDPRNAYRWLHKLSLKLMNFRQGLTLHAPSLAERFKTRTRRLRVILPTLQTLFSTLPTNPCTHYQHRRQTAFI